MKSPIDYTAEDFINEPDRKKRRAMFLDSTVAFYNSNNRAVGEIGCVYEPTADSPGCAVGRFAIAAHHCHGPVSDHKVFYKLPAWMQYMGERFLQEVQYLHDRLPNWNATGLSPTGEHEVQRIRNEFL